ncbi:MAG: type II toxin-antitoxin system RelE/ParE family toxin [Alphaproteobacteria bacterium]|nr:type II toxin-antitoxin system RelE/ParE family toxin [Alphaproteobacteria bacterium]MDP6591306.1 type II toxin-antitoxin system RelE/ParE family toxin [Alphaproteobacteria bacterium]
MIIPRAAKELAALAHDQQAHFLHISEMLMELGPANVREPYVKKLREGLWEMRLRGKSGIARAAYFTASGGRLVVVSAFVKKTQRTPKRELALAIKRMKEWKNG